MKTPKRKKTGRPKLSRTPVQLCPDKPRGTKNHLAHLSMFYDEQKPANT